MKMWKIYIRYEYIYILQKGLNFSNFMSMKKIELFVSFEFTKWGYRGQRRLESTLNAHNSKSRRASIWIKSLSIQPRNPPSQLSPYLPSISTIITFQPTSRPTKIPSLSLSLSQSFEREVKRSGSKIRLEREHKSTNSRNNSICVQMIRMKSWMERSQLP